MSTPITTPPNGYSTFSKNGVQYMWAFAPTQSILASTTFEFFRDTARLFTRNDANEVVIDESVASTLHYKLVKDSELPVQTIIENARYEFNESTGKYETANMLRFIHNAHEHRHDADVAAAVVAVCGVEIDLQHRRAILANLTPDQKTKANAEYTQFDDCIDEIVDEHALPVIKRAWIQSLGDVRHTGTGFSEAVYVDAAHDFATQFIAHVQSRTPVQLGARRYEYHICMFRSLLEDSGKSVNRFLPKEVKIEKRPSASRNNERTIAQVFAAVKALVSPAEGAPKRA